MMISPQNLLAAFLLLLSCNGSIFHSTPADSPDSGVVIDYGASLSCSNNPDFAESTCFDHGEGVFTLTDTYDRPVLVGDVGCAWSDQPIDLSMSFAIEADFKFGDHWVQAVADGEESGDQTEASQNNNGGAGMALALKATTDPNVCGDGNKNKGYGNIEGDYILAVEVDTLDSDGDAKIALTTGSHDEVLLGPVSLGNVEDDEWHSIRLEYYEPKDELVVYFDHDSVLRGSNLCVSDELNTPTCNWGFTASNYIEADQSLYYDDDEFGENHGSHQQVRFVHFENQPSTRAPSSPTTSPTESPSDEAEFQS